MPARMKVDYDSLEPDWRAGLKSPEQMSQEYEARTGVKVTRQAIIKHFKKKGIERDLTARIVDKAKSMVAAAEAKVAAIEAKVADSDKLSEKDIIELNAKTSSDIQLRERKDIIDARKIVSKLWEELKTMVDCPDELAMLGELMKDPTESVDRLFDCYMKVVNFPGRVDSAKKLADAMGKLIDMERLAYGIKEPDAPPKYQKIEIFTVSPKNRPIDNGYQGDD